MVKDERLVRAIGATKPFEYDGTVDTLLYYMKGNKRIMVGNLSLPVFRSGDITIRPSSQGERKISCSSLKQKLTYEEILKIDPNFESKRTQGLPQPEINNHNLINLIKNIRNKLPF
jgi:hypothetical protein